MGGEGYDAQGAILQRRRRLLVLLSQQEEDEIVVGHAVILSLVPKHPQPVDDPRGEAVLAIAQDVFLLQQRVFVLVQLPKETPGKWT